MKDLFGDSLDNQNVSDLIAEFDEWINSSPGKDSLKCAENMIKLLPSNLSTVGLLGKNLYDHSREVFSRWLKQLASRWQNMEESLNLANESYNNPEISEQEKNQSLKLMNVWSGNKKRYMNRFVVDTLSRGAVIPTYSFPVHSVHLEIIQSRDEYNNQDDRLQMERSATLAIGEYAPDSEVVAGGRIWISKGIVKRGSFGNDRPWVEEGKYRVCSKCQHPEIVQDQQEFSDSCQQCGEMFGQSPRYYTEPLGFLTSYEGRTGRDPGNSRLRSKPVEEARLVTRSAPSDFNPTDLAQVTSYFAPAIAPEGEISGKMFVVNKGPNGTGYLRCKKCEFSAPAPYNCYGKNEVQIKHGNPRTGDKCPVEMLSFPQDLAHLFETDIRILQINEQIPTSSELQSEEEFKQQHAMFLRTLAESMRIAAAELLGTDPRDLRASTESPNNIPHVILSDAVPGGAGYCRRLIDEYGFTAKELFLKAQTILDCPNSECRTSCSRCLREYSNQQHWDLLNRELVLKWLNQVIEFSKPRPKYVPASAIPVSSTAVHLLREKLISAKEISVCSGKFWGAENREEALISARYIRDALEHNNSHLTFVTSNKIIPVSETGLDREIAKMFERLEEEKLIKFAVLDKSILKNAPRLCIIGDKVEEFFGNTFSAPSLDGLFSGIEFRWTGNLTQSWIGQNRDKFVQQPSVLSLAMAKLKSWHFSQGQKRNVPELFSIFASRPISVRIEDPWIGSREGGRKAFGELLNSLLVNDSKITDTHIVLRTNGYDTDSEKIQLNGLKQQATNSGVHGKIYFEKRNSRNKHFHDRKILIQTDDDGNKIIARYDVTAGVDNLMNRNKECSVFQEILS